MGQRWYVSCYYHRNANARVSTNREREKERKRMDRSIILLRHSISPLLNAWESWCEKRDYTSKSTGNGCSSTRTLAKCYYFASRIIAERYTSRVPFNARKYSRCYVNGRSKPYCGLQVDFREKERNMFLSRSPHRENITRGEVLYIIRAFKTFIYNNNGCDAEMKIMIAKLVFCKTRNNNLNENAILHSLSIRFLISFLSRSFCNKFFLHRHFFHNF